MVAAGSYRDRVTFQVETRTADGGGGSSSSWTSLDPVWCRVMPERGNERIEGGRLNSVIAVTIHVRSSTETRAVTTDDRAVIDGTPHQIRSITNPDRRGRVLEMVLDRGVGQ